MRCYRKPSIDCRHSGGDERGNEGTGWRTADIRQYCFAYRVHSVERPNVYELLYPLRMGEHSADDLV